MNQMVGSTFSCLEDCNLFQAIQTLQRNITPRKRSASSVPFVSYRCYGEVFLGKEIVNALLNGKCVKSEKEACELASLLIHGQFLNRTSRKKKNNSISTSSESLKTQVNTSPSLYPKKKFRNGNFFYRFHQNMPSSFIAFECRFNVLIMRENLLGKKSVGGDEEPLLGATAGKKINKCREYYITISIGSQYIESSRIKGDLEVYWPETFRFVLLPSMKDIQLEVTLWYKKVSVLSSRNCSRPIGYISYSFAKLLQIYQPGKDYFSTNLMMKKTRVLKEKIATKKNDVSSLNCELGLKCKIFLRKNAKMQEPSHDGISNTIKEPEAFDFGMHSQNLLCKIDGSSSDPYIHIDSNKLRRKDSKICLKKKRLSDIQAPSGLKNSKIIKNIMKHRHNSFHSGERLVVSDEKGMAPNCISEAISLENIPFTSPLQPLHQVDRPNEPTQLRSNQLKNPSDENQSFYFIFNLSEESVFFLVTAISCFILAFSFKG